MPAVIVTLGLNVSLETLILPFVSLTADTNYPAVVLSVTSKALIASVTVFTVAPLFVLALYPSAKT